MKNLYIIFSSTDLKIGRMIRFVTRNEYNHCSVCIDSGLSVFYSFSRLYMNNPLIGGFTAESPKRYTLSSRTKVKVVAVPVFDADFREIKALIRRMSDNAEEYVYNYFSAAAYIFGRKYDSDNAFTCAEFTNKVLALAGVDAPESANIERMERALEGYPTWEGRAVDGFFSPIWGEDRYLDRIGKAAQCVLMAKRFKRLLVGSRV